MQQVFLPILTILLALTLSSCEDVVEVNLSDEKVSLYSVEAKITTENEPHVLLYHSIRVDSEASYPGISDAEIIISDDQIPANRVQLVEYSKYKGFYTTPGNESFRGVPGREYTITIKIEGITLTASDKLSPVEPIDSIQVRASLRGDRRFLGVFTYGVEPPGVGDYYKWDIYINNLLLTNAENFAIASDEFVDGKYINGLEIFTDFHNPDEEDEQALVLNDTIFVKQTSVSEFAYSYYNQMFDQSTTGSLFSVPPANIESNFVSSDGKPVLGIFTAHDVSISNVVVIDEEILSGLREY